MDIEEIKEYLIRSDRLERKLKGKDKETLQWLIYGYNECAKLLNQRERAIQQVIKHIRNKIRKSFEFDSGISPKNYKDRLFTETIVELQCIEEMLKK